MHTPVLVDEVLEGLRVRQGGWYLDGTLGGGGHAEALLRRSAPNGRLLGLDRDAIAIRTASERLSAWAPRLTVQQGAVADLDVCAKQARIEAFDGIVLDLGVSSFQLDDPSRGFSFQSEGPLDMRMDRSQPGTAADLIACASEEQLTDWLRTLGEEPDARRIARAIVAERKRGPIESTLHLADLVARVKGGRRGRLHPATRTFQALRIAVNEELDHVARGLEAALRWLRPGGRMAVISFHRLEDRLVKQWIVRHTPRWESLAEGGRKRVGEPPWLQAVTRRPVTPSREEVCANPRARSAKLRVAERMKEP